MTIDLATIAKRPQARYAVEATEGEIGPVLDNSRKVINLLFSDSKDSPRREGSVSPSRSSTSAELNSKSEQILSY